MNHLHFFHSVTRTPVGVYDFPFLRQNRYPIPARAIRPSETPTPAPIAALRELLPPPGVSVALLVGIVERDVVEIDVDVKDADVAVVVS